MIVCAGSQWSSASYASPCSACILIYLFGSHDDCRALSFLSAYYFAQILKECSLGMCDCPALGSADSPSSPPQSVSRAHSSGFPGHLEIIGPRNPMANSRSTSCNCSRAGTFDARLAWLLLFAPGCDRPSTSSCFFRCSLAASFHFLENSYRSLSGFLTVRYRWCHSL